jgi:antitoxin (DNA-binding transcriptional repressor) of toxin-antitoxin stability system
MDIQADDRRLPMRQIDLSGAKTSLSRLVGEALGGEEIVLARAGRPLVRLVPCRAENAPCRPSKAKLWMAEDFDAPLDGELGASLRGERPRRQPVKLLLDTHASLIGPRTIRACRVGRAPPSSGRATSSRSAPRRSGRSASRWRRDGRAPVQ